MYKEAELARLQAIAEKIEILYKIIERHNGIVNALNDFEGQPAVFMLLVAISEQFDKLKKHNAEVLKQFADEDIKGITAVRNFIAHDYDGVNLAIIETDLRENMPLLLQTIQAILKHS